ncbi:MAG TPA: HAMP domain-containing sensor histidine kinase [Polyangia bacterium]|nr:HAMP domain-containing sensor histidine kinase [Polyangia bacterium]
MPFSQSKLGRALDRAGPMIVALVLGAVLIASSSLSYRDAQRAAALVAERQGVGLLHRLDSVLGPRPDDKALAAALEASRALGLRYLGFVDHGRIVAAAGEARLPSVPLAMAPPTAGLDRVRMTGPGPHPPSGRPLGGPPPDWLPGDRPSLPAPPPFRDGPPPDQMPGLMGGPPHGPHPFLLVIEFEPIASKETVRRALTVLWLSFGAAILLTAAAVVLSAKARRAARAEAALSAQHHLAQLGELSAVLAHEIRNPLAALKGHAQLLAEEIPAGAAAGRVAHVVEGAVRLERLTNDLLAFARSGALQIAAVDPAAPLERAAHALGSDQIEIDTAGAPARFELDATRLEETLRNLLENALAVTPPIGKVRARVTTADGALIYSVQDQGPGIAPAERARVFEPFHTTKTRGTGLGLAVAKRIVDLHGGRIDVADAPGGGAIFKVVIPPRDVWRRS